MARRKSDRDIDPALPIDQVLAVTGISRSTLWRLMREGNFPAAIKLTDRKLGWRQSAIKAWLDSRPKATHADRAA